MNNWLINETNLFIFKFSFKVKFFCIIVCVLFPTLKKCERKTTLIHFIGLYEHVFTIKS